jgi:O-antigen/teichoic acid export membrane protein
MIRLFASFLVGVWVARYLAPQKFGILSYCLAFTFIFSGLAKLGLDGIIVRSLVKEPHKKDLYLGTAFWLKVVGAVFTLLIIFLILPFTNNDSKTNIYILIIATGTIFQSFEVIDFYFQSKVLSKFVAVCKVIQLSASSLLRISFILLGADLIWFVLVTVIEMAVLALGLNIVYKIRQSLLFYKYFDWQIAKRLLRDSWPLVLSGIATAIYMRIDQIMIKQMLGEQEVGFYSAAVKISEIWYFLPVLLCNSLFPAIIKAKTTNNDMYNQRMRMLYTLLAWIAISIIVPISFISRTVIVGIFGSAYSQASSVLVIHIWGAVFVFLGVAFHNYLLAENLTKVALYRTILGALINIVLNLSLIPIYGISGAAFATLISQAATNYFYDVFSRRFHKQLALKTLAIIWPFPIIKFLQGKK